MSRGHPGGWKVPMVTGGGCTLELQFFLKRRRNCRVSWVAFIYSRLPSVTTLSLSFERPE